LSARFESTNKDKISTTKGSATKLGSMTDRGPNRMADVHGLNLRGAFKEGQYANFKKPILNKLPDYQNQASN